jgi:hypothetical protein
MNKKELINAIAKELDTRDKRFIFLFLEFKSEAYSIDIEGPSTHCASNIILKFKSIGKLEKLINCFNLKFDYNINI